MSTVAPEAPRIREDRAPPGGHRGGFTPSRESAGWFAAAYLAYSVLGYFVVVRWNIVVGDAWSRLAHAYFVWFNEPPKLTAVGFVWPPLMTIVLLPLALVKPLATSLLALPLTSAFFGAALIAMVERTLAILGLSRRVRWPLVLLLAFNPMVLYYAANGMGETLYLFLLVAAVYFFLLWHAERRTSYLVATSLALALGLLTRYELLFWLLAIGVAIIVVLIRRGVSRDELEGTVLAFFAPAVYALGLWMFFNWLILGDPLWWLQSEVTLTFEETRREVIEPTHEALWRSMLITLSVTWHLFPATFVVIGALLALFALRRDLVALTLAVAVLLNPVTTAVLAVAAQTDFVYQLRYNMRSLPLAVIGTGWLLAQMRGRRAREAAWVISVALLAVSLVFSWRTMQTYERQAFEQAFTRALATGEDQEGTRSHGSGLPVGIAPERAAAEWILAHVEEPNAILADDAQAFSVMLLTGRPELFLDRIDVGDEKWRDVLERPRGRAAYFLTTRDAIQGRDLVRERYPELLNDGVRWLRPVYTNDRWALLRVGPSAPLAPDP